ncbi:DUF4190 domain-containing protein [Cellulomonas triticagri]|uniref:DUF4190 domain-containing protein n=1 Tax=Cellulomonas triticagri TaxID=2483352 RepID=A0A3M2JJN3_9CELL|nr:DUF4190 domain-containing protein [Cellulomonas triticagri]
MPPEDIAWPPAPAQPAYAAQAPYPTQPVQPASSPYGPPSTHAPQSPTPGWPGPTGYASAWEPQAPLPAPTGTAPAWAPDPTPTSPAAPTYPAPGGYAQPWSPPPGPPPTDPLAVASLVTSCTGLLIVLGAPVGLGLGIAALRRIRRTGASGRGLALAGTWIGAVLTGVFTLGLVAAVVIPVALNAQDGTTTSTGTSDEEQWAQDTTMPPFELSLDLAPGQCLATAPEAYDMSDAAVVDCGAAHETEVLEMLAMSAPVLEDLTAPDAGYTELLDRCEQAVATAVDPAVLPVESYADVYYPHPSQWEGGGRTAYCVLTTFPAATGSAVAGTFAAGGGTSA